MYFRITCDANEESGIGRVVDAISGPTRQRFVPRDYGSGMPRLGIVLMCRNPALNFKRRIRFSKKDGTLFMDVMLSLPEMIRLSHEERSCLVMQRLEREIPEILSKYRFPDFDIAKFQSDLHDWSALNSASMKSRENDEPTARKRLTLWELLLVIFGVGIALAWLLSSYAKQS